jgi:hypothetical protein
MKIIFAGLYNIPIMLRKELKVKPAMNTLYTNDLKFFIRSTETSSV